MSFFPNIGLGRLSAWEVFHQVFVIFFFAINKTKQFNWGVCFFYWEGKGREGKGREGKGRDGKGRVSFFNVCVYYYVCVLFSVCL